MSRSTAERIGIPLLLVAFGAVLALWAKSCSESPDTKIIAVAESLAQVNMILNDSTNRVLARADSATRRADSLSLVVDRTRTKARAAERAADSLELLIPDTARIVTRDLHDLIVAQKDLSIASLHEALHKSGEIVVDQGKTISGLRSQVVILQQSNNDLLEKYTDLANKYRKRHWRVGCAGGYGIITASGTVRAGFPSATCGVTYTP